jgi:4-amino-4-deoxy-L-arabinose transferase-like glycosyltransferase
MQKPLLAGLGVIWAVLLAHNAFLLPLAAGFDARDHLSYVKYLQEHKSMPSPNEGFEMFQPPLYHASAALLLGLLHLTTSDMTGLVALRLFSLLVGALQLTLVFAGLRLIFPGQWKKQVAGVALGAFLPMFICLLHYPTNETLSAMLVTAALYVCLRMLRESEPSPKQYAALGVLLGLAMLTKASALVAMAALYGVLAVKLLSQGQRAPKVWFGTLGLSLEICLAICGWHYWNMWRHFGNPFTGNWDPAIAVPWWQYPGFHTWKDYLSFGPSLAHPLFSSFDSVWDSLYSTMWGDGLCGGPASLPLRPPWNYHFMVIGFVFALAPAALILTGFIRAAVQCWRTLRLDWLLLTGLAALYGMAVIFMTLKLPMFSQAKSFYGLAALLPLCCFGVLGWEFWTGASRARQLFLLTVLGTWFARPFGSVPAPSMLNSPRHWRRSILGTTATRPRGFKKCLRWTLTTVWQQYAWPK